MFERSAAPGQHVAASIRLATDTWNATAEGWFDGTVHSVDRRIATGRALRHQAHAAGFEYAATVMEMDRQLGQLASLREQFDATEAPVHQAATPGIDVTQKFGQWAQQHNVAEPTHRHVSIFANNFTLPLNDVQTLHAAIDQGKFVSPQVREAVHLAARDFVRQMDDDVLPREEIVFRAHRHASNQVWNLPKEAGDKWVGAFTDAVVALAARRPRTASAPAPPTTVVDYPDFMLTM